MILLTRVSPARGRFKVGAPILTAELAAVLRESGADLVGFGDISGLSGAWPRCVALAAALPVSIIRGIADGPTPDYYEQYHALNARLDSLAELAASYIRERGFRALAQTTTVVVESAGYRTPFPHKTCATRSGLGWIGKSALLVTPAFGPAVRLSSVLTDAALDRLGEPINTSLCGGCTRCQDHCPGRAIQGGLWDVSVEREALVDVEACRQAARALAWERLGKKITLCGRCIEVCPYTQSYIKATGGSL